MLRDFSLELLGVSNIHNGTYTVVTHNGVGDPVQSSLTVLVYPVPLSVSVSSDSLHVGLQSDISVQCDVKGKKNLIRF